MHSPFRIREDNNFEVVFLYYNQIMNLPEGISYSMQFGGVYVHFVSFGQCV